MTSPATQVQFGMLNLLCAELTALGAQDITLTDYGAALATIPAPTDAPTIAVLAHIDTAPADNTTRVKPRVHRGYTGGAISHPDAALTCRPKALPNWAESLATPSSPPLASFFWARMTRPACRSQ